MLIQVSNHQVADLPSLIRLVLRYIYESDKMRIDEISIMQHSITKWTKKYGINDFEKEILELMAELLKKNEEGHLDKRKALFRIHGIDWRKFHRLPESYA